MQPEPENEKIARDILQEARVPATYRLPGFTREKLSRIAKSWGCSRTSVIIRLVEHARNPTT
jgi:hypothetical protein